MFADLPRAMPLASWFMPSYISSDTPAATSSSTAASMSATSKLNTVNVAGLWSSF
jgi:hypothetical protein